ncbi:hypothetical protein OFR41_13640 [Brachyspira hyodysenteriae]|nr:hypothetical protein [Brachyspira hyodysenteriae]MDA0050236.1 hypothetical protein [Brachyspira hyodysenteriae]
MFNNFDYVFNFVFLGGEPFIYKELLQLLEYISKYKKHIGEVSIVTNGTILPNNDILNIVKENDIHIQISNYNVSENYISKLKKLESILITNGINYNINNHLSWKDFVFPRKGFHLESDNIIKHMLNCNPVFKGVTESRFYFCHIVWSAVKSGLIKHNSNDSIDISQKLNDNEKLNLLKFSLGLFDAKYISLCEFCAGCGTDNKLFIKAGFTNIVLF